jgi:hypothetical protein
LVSFEWKHSEVSEMLIEYNTVDLVEGKRKSIRFLFFIVVVSYFTCTRIATQSDRMLEIILMDDTRGQLYVCKVSD